MAQHSKDHHSSAGLDGDEAAAWNGEYSMAARCPSPRSWESPPNTEHALPADYVQYDRFSKHYTGGGASSAGHQPLYSWQAARSNSSSSEGFYSGQSRYGREAGGGGKHYQAYDAAANRHAPYGMGPGGPGASRYNTNSSVDTQGQQVSDARDG